MWQGYQAINQLLKPGFSITAEIWVGKRRQQPAGCGNGVRAARSRDFRHMARNVSDNRLIYITFPGVRKKTERQEPTISRVLSGTTIHLRQPSPAACSNLPGSPLGAGGACRFRGRRTPLFGLAPGGVYRAAACYHPRGALLPHLFTLTVTCVLGRCIFCGTFHGLAPSRGYLAPCPKEPGLSSTGAHTPGRGCLVDSCLPERRMILQKRGRGIARNLNPPCR